MKTLLIAKNSQGKIELALCPANLWRYKVTYTKQDPFYTGAHYPEDQRMLAIQNAKTVALEMFSIFTECDILPAFQWRIPDNLQNAISYAYRRLAGESSDMAEMAAFTFDKYFPELCSKLNK